MAHTIPVKHSVALAIHRTGKPREVLAVQRPDEPGEELPGVWGLPAATQRPGETLEDAARRAARDKLGLELRKLHPLGRGTQIRTAYTLDMVLFEAETAAEPQLRASSEGQPGTTYYTAWQWAPGETLREAAELGSLCSQLYLSKQR